MHHRTLFTAGAALLLLPLSLVAQIPTQASDPELDRTCKELATRPLKAVAEVLAFGFDLRRCDESGPEILAASWLSFPADTTILSGLASMSEQMHDRRIAEVLERIVADHKAPYLLRSGAVAVLGVYLRDFGSTTIVEASISPTGVTFMTAFISHRIRMPVSQPYNRVEHGVRTRAILQAIARDSTEPLLLRSAAAAIVSTEQPPAR